MTRLDGLFDIGGHRLYLRCQGAGHPTVLLEAGMGDGTSLGAWERLEPQVAAFTTVCSYDRAGRGRSDPGPGPRTSGRMVQELHSVLKVAGAAPPYVLVGHSFGGITVRLFASRYPAEVVGLVLLDPSHEEGRVRSSMLASPDERTSQPSTNPEGVDWEASIAELAASEPLPPVPVVVLSRGLPALAPPDWPAERVARWEEVWRELQEDLVRRMPGSRHVIATRSRHYVQRFEPELVTAVIREMVDRQ